MLQDEVVSPPIKWNRIWLPVLLSVGVSFYLIYTNFSAEALHKIAPKTAPEQYLKPLSHFVPKAAPNIASTTAPKTIFETVQLLNQLLKQVPN